MNFLNVEDTEYIFSRWLCIVQDSNILKKVIDIRHEYSCNSKCLNYNYNI